MDAGPAQPRGDSGMSCGELCWGHRACVHLLKSCFLQCSQKQNSAGPAQNTASLLSRDLRSFASSLENGQIISLELESAHPYKGLQKPLSFSELGVITPIHSCKEVRGPDCQYCVLSTNEHPHRAEESVTEAAKITRVFSPAWSW